MPPARTKSCNNVTNKETQKSLQEEPNVVTTPTAIISEENIDLTSSLLDFIDKKDAPKYLEDIALRTQKLKENAAVTSTVNEDNNTERTEAAYKLDTETTQTPEDAKEVTLLNTLIEPPKTTPAAESERNATSTSTIPESTSTIEPTSQNTSIGNIDFESANNRNQAVAIYFNKKIEETLQRYRRLPERSDYDREVNSILHDLQKLPEHTAIEEDFSRIESVLRELLIYQIQRELLEAEAREAREYLRNLIDNDAVDYRIKIDAIKQSISLLEAQEGRLKNLEEALRKYEVFVNNLSLSAPSAISTDSEIVFTFEQILRLLQAINETL
ncbi:hypothetical protein GQX74_014154 [Glossina fuscipes]|nr:hypothetical protein GQX74_014154 [Glossina fuscipes]